MPELWSTIWRLVTAVIADSSCKAACMGTSLVAEDLLRADGDCNSTPYDSISDEYAVIRTKHRCKCSSKTPRSSFVALTSLTSMLCCTTNGSSKDPSIHPLGRSQILEADHDSTLATWQHIICCLYEHGINLRHLREVRKCWKANPASH